MEKIYYQSPPVGQEISCVMSGIEESLLNGKKLKSLIINSLKKDNFNILDIKEFNFKPKGYTLLVLLAESHLAIHTYPEYNSFYFNMYSCRGPKDSEYTFNFIKEKLSPSHVNILKKIEVPIKYF